MEGVVEESAMGDYQFCGGVWVVDAVYSCSELLSSFKSGKLELLLMFASLLYHMKSLLPFKAEWRQGHLICIY